MMRAGPLKWIGCLFILLQICELQCQSSLPCQLGSLKVTTIDKGKGKGLTVEEVKGHILQRGVNFSSIDENLWSCVDGRSHLPVFGTPGGDAGEFIMGLTLYENERGSLLTSEEVQDLFDEFMSIISFERRFYMHTDEQSLSKLRRFLNNSNFDPEDVDHTQQERIKMLLTRPVYIGCGHIRLMILKEKEYKVRKEVVVYFIQAFFLFKWNNEHSEKLSHLIDYVQLEGDHDERAVVVLNTNYSSVPPDHQCRKVGPMVAPASPPNSFFIYHQSLVGSIRTKVADFFQQKLDNDSEPLLPMMNTLSALQVSLTLSSLAPGEPIFAVEVEVLPVLSPTSEEGTPGGFPAWGAVLLTFGIVFFIGTAGTAVFVWWRKRKVVEVEGDPVFFG